MDAREIFEPALKNLVLIASDSSCGSDKPAHLYNFLGASLVFNQRVLISLFEQ